MVFIYNIFQKPNLHDNFNQQISQMGPVPIPLIIFCYESKALRSFPRRKESKTEKERKEKENFVSWVNFIRT